MLLFRIFLGCLQGRVLREHWTEEMPGQPVGRMGGAAAALSWCWAFSVDLCPPEKCLQPQVQPVGHLGNCAGVRGAPGGWSSPEQLRTCCALSTGHSGSHSFFITACRMLTCVVPCPKLVLEPSTELSATTPRCPFLLPLGVRERMVTDPSLTVARIHLG